MANLTARTLVTSIGTVEYALVAIGATGLIEDISSDASVSSDRTLTPTFFDIHIHGAAGEDVMEASAQGLSRIQRFLASRGTSHYLPTTVTAPTDKTLRALERLAAAVARPCSENEAQPVGIHLEGPFLAHGKRGVHPAELLQPPTIELFERFQQAAGGHIRLLTLAPELDGALELIGHAVGAGVRVSLGHSLASGAEAARAIAAGAASATHTFNAMRGLEAREPGLLGVVLDSSAGREGLFAELICDGVHVAPALVRMWLRLKGERAILVTDGISATGMGDGEYRLAGLAVTVREGRCTLTSAPGTLAGSVLTLDRAVANLQRFTGASLAEAVRCASTQPAALLGLGDTIASLRVGQPASFNQFTADGRVEATWLYGRRIS